MAAPQSTAAASASQIEAVSGLLNSNFMSFDSPQNAIVDSNLKLPLVPKPCNLDQIAVSPTITDFDLTTSTPFEGDLTIPKFTFDNKLGDIMEDPFDLVERKAVQDSNDPFERVQAEAAAQQPIMSFTDSLSNSKNSFLNDAFFNGNDSSTGLTADFDKLDLASGALSEDGDKIISKKDIKLVQSDEWLENEIPPWEANEDDENLVAETNDCDSDGKEEVFDAVQQVSTKFPKVAAAIIEDLNTDIIKKLKLRSPVLKIVPELDLSPAAESLDIPNISLRSVDLSFLNVGSDSMKSPPVTPLAKNNLDEWKKQILENAQGFSKHKKNVVCAKPFSQPLGAIDVNSPGSSYNQLTPIKAPSALPRSNLPTPKFRSKLLKPRYYGTNKENQ